MTNADKYLKDGVSVEEFKTDFCRYLSINGYDTSTVGNVCFALEHFLKQSATPTLTEDERVILKNINEKYIGREKIGWLYICDEPNEKGYYHFSFYNHLFQFIKERRRIRDKGVAEK